jgi:alcohol dehydrogenase
MCEQRIYFEIFGCRIEFGWKALSTLGAHAKNLGSKKALIVTDEGLFAMGVPQTVSSALEEANIRCVLFSEISPNPTDMTPEC